MRLFVSFSRVDERLANDVAGVLDELQVEYKADIKDVDWAEDVPATLSNGLAAATDYLVVVSPASLGSAWLPFEAGLAIGQHKTLLSLTVHPALALPGYLQASRALTDAEHVRAYLTQPTHAPEALEPVRPLDPDDTVLLCESAATVAVDLMRLFLGVASPRAYARHVDRYGELHHGLARSWDEFHRAWMKVELADDRLRSRSVLLSTRLSWLLARLGQPPPRFGIERGYFEVFVALHRELVVLVAALIPNTATDLRAWIERHLALGEHTAPSDADALIALRHRLQGAFLESGRIVTIWDDVDHKLAIPYLMIDERLIPHLSGII